MTEITVCGSSSQGNGYLLKSGDQILVLELGCRMQDYIDAVGKDFIRIVGCAYTHNHSDHNNIGTASQFLRRGIPIYSHGQVIKESKVMGFSPLLSHFQNKVGGFIIQTFEATHNVPNYGFLIQTPTNERILFVTDTTGVNLRFRDIDCIMVEANFDDDVLLDNLSNKEVSQSHPENHLGLSDCICFCKQNISVNTKQIILIHLSSANINPYKAVEETSKAINNDAIKVDFAERGKKFIVESDFF